MLCRSVMAGNVKRNTNGSVQQDFFKIIFHGADCQTISLFSRQTVPESASCYKTDRARQGIGKGYRIARCLCAEIVAYFPFR